MSKRKGVFPQIHQTQIVPLRTRLGHLCQRFLFGAKSKRKRLYRLDIGNVKVKRIVFPEEWRAKEAAGQLREFRGLNLFPEVIGQHGTDLWVEFLEGVSVSPANPNTVSELARIYGTLYSKAPRTRRLDSGGWLDDIQFDLSFLKKTGVLKRELHDILQRRLVDWAPDLVWVGWEYSDPRLANLIQCRDGSQRFVDIESLRNEWLLGTGVARACFKLSCDRRQTLLKLVRDHAAPHICDAFPFVELSALSSWTRRTVLLRKPKLVRLELFENIAKSD